MKKHSRESKPTPFEVALEKGDYELPSEVPRKYTSLDDLFAFISVYERLGTPGPEVLYRLGKWKSHQGDIKATALELDIDPRTLYKWFERLVERYEKKSHPPPPKKKRGE